MGLLCWGSNFVRCVICTFDCAIFAKCYHFFFFLQCDCSYFDGMKIAIELKNQLPPPPTLENCYVFHRCLNTVKIKKASLHKFIVCFHGVCK
jgi:hypothetical protein